MVNDIGDTEEVAKRKGSKLLLVAYGFTVLLLLMMVLVAGTQTHDNYVKYGASYEVVTIIGGVETRTIVYFNMNMLSLLFLMWLVYLLCIPLIEYLRQKPTQSSEEIA